MMEKICRIAFWLAAAFAVTMALLPHPPGVPGEPSDKVQHIAAFTTLAVLAVLGYPRVSWTVIAAGLVAVGAMIEILQMIPMLHRDAEVGDLVADAAAVIAVLGVFIAARAIRSRR